MKMRKCKNNKLNMEQKQFILDNYATMSNKEIAEKIGIKDVYNHPTKDLKDREDYDKIKAYNELFSLRPLGNMLVGHRDFNVSLEDLEQYDLRRNQTT